MTDELSRNERIKEASDYLRGTLAEGLREEVTGAIVGLRSPKQVDGVIGAAGFRLSKEEIGEISGFLAA